MSYLFKVVKVNPKYEGRFHRLWLAQKSPPKKAQHLSYP